MRFNEIIQNQLEVDDNVLEDYILNRDDDEYSVEDFIDFFTTEYYVDDFVDFADTQYDLKKEYFLDELNRVKNQMKND